MKRWPWANLWIRSRKVANPSFSMDWAESAKKGWTRIKKIREGQYPSLPLGFFLDFARHWNVATSYMLCLISSTGQCSNKNNSGAMAWKRQCGSEAVMPVQPVGQLLPPPPSPPSPPSPPPPPSSYADNTPPTWHSFYNWTSLGLDKVILCAFSDLFHQAGQAMFVGLLDLKAPDTREGTIDYQGWPSSFVPNVYLAQLSSFCIFCGHSIVFVVLLPLQIGIVNWVWNPRCICAGMDPHLNKRGKEFHPLGEGESGFLEGNSKQNVYWINAEKNSLWNWKNKDRIWAHCWW